MVAKNGNNHLSSFARTILIGPTPIPPGAGTNPQLAAFSYNEYYQLEGGQVLIRGVTIDAGNCPLPVYIWQGRSPNLGTPTIVLPGWSRGFSVEGTSGIFLSMKGVPQPPVQAKGTLYICVSDEPVQAFGMITSQSSPPNSPDIGPQSVLTDYMI